MKKAASARATDARHELVRVARKAFQRHGYAGAGTNEIVEKARLTRGALYYHFKDKRDLLRAVVEEIAEEIVVEIEARAMATSGPWVGLEAGCLAFLEVCSRPEIRGIYLIDAPAHLGWALWRRIDAESGMGSLERGLTACLALHGPVERHRLEALTHLIAGALNEAALAIAEAPQPEQALEEMSSGVRWLLGAVRMTAEVEAPPKQA
jgi:AcrR family transcriptional regulator